MSRIIVALITLGGAAGLVLAQRASRIELGAVVVELQAQAAQVGGAVTTLENQLQTLRSKLQSETNRTAELHTEMAALSADPDGVANPPLTPETDGIWPANQKWFYLPKTQLTRLGFDSFLIDGRLSEEAALLFGLSPAERGAVEDALANLKHGLSALELANLTPVTPKDWDMRHNPKKKLESYQLPALDSASLRSQFQEAIQTNLGDNRAGFFLPVSDAYLVQVLDDIGAYPRYITHLTDPADPEPWERIDVWMTKSNSELDKCLYPEDETAAGFQHYAQLFQAYGQSTNSPHGR